MNAKKTQTKKPVKKKKVIRTNTPRERGVYKSYSIRLPKRDLDRLQKQARKQQISVNTLILTKLFPPAPVVPIDEIDDPSKYREGDMGAEVANA